MTEQALLELLSKMSLLEKAMQLTQVPGEVFDPDAIQTGVISALVSPEVKRLAGSTLGVMDAGKARRIQTAYIENHPHRIPLLLMADVIHGHRTVFPCPLGQGASFDPDLTCRAAAVQAQEAAADGIHVTFSPMADLVRDARWGRVMESTGEDKTLNARMAAAMVRGYQGASLLDGNTVASCVKHFAAYGAADAGRDYNNTELSEHTLREDYLPAYQAAVRAGARLAMSSFNSWNGVPVTGSEYLLKTVLRDEMGFTGVTISDWDAVGQLVPHGFAEDGRDAAEKAMNAGVDIDMCTGAYGEHLISLVEEGKVSEGRLNEAVLRVLRLKNELGLFENPFRGLDGQKEALSAREKRDLARKAAAESLVLLKNENGVLPLKAKKIAFIGPYADCGELHSSWAIHPNKEACVTVLQAAEKALKDGAEIRFAPGCPMLDNGTELSVTVYQSETWEEDSRRMLAEAKENAAWADTVVLCLGEHILQSGESTSRAQLSLPEVQMRLLDAVSGACPRVVTLLFCGRPLEVKKIADRSQALVVCWRPGTEGGSGIMDVLTGREPPSGCLPVSFPWTVGQEPLHYDVYATGRPRPEDGPSLFTSRYLDCPNTALYPFGFGLSYGQVSVSGPEISGNALTGEGALTVRAALRNTGAETAAHTVQLYLRDLVGSRVRPVKELKDFRRVRVLPGEEITVEFEITEPMLRFLRADGVFASEPGKFQAFVALNSRDGEPVAFELK